MKCSRLRPPSFTYTVTSSRPNNSIVFPSDSNNLVIADVVPRFINTATIPTFRVNSLLITFGRIILCKTFQDFVLRVFHSVVKIVFYFWYGDVKRPSRVATQKALFYVYLLGGELTAGFGSARETIGRISCKFWFSGRFEMNEGTCRTYA
jgi:hypothetical protein